MYKAKCNFFTLEATLIIKQTTKKESDLSRESERQTDRQTDRQETEEKNKRRYREKTQNRESQIKDIYI